ncbi:MAG: Ribonuclease protein component [Segetibacter sp.]|nr:Ribonuclease protein component [Segetibacter sp.]
MFCIICPIFRDGAFIFKTISISRHFTFNKDERLKSRKFIDQLFNKGKSFSSFPIKVLYDFTEDTTVPLKAGVTVSSRNFKKAVQRNRVKRILREAYRLQKIPLQEMLVGRQKSLVLFFIYTGKELPVYNEVFEKMGIVLRRLHDNIINQS